MKKITLFTIALLCVSQTYAAEEAEKEQFLVSPIGDNWTISVGAGAEFHPHRKLIDNPTLDVPTSFQVDLSVGKWLNPYMGLRVETSYSTFDVTSTATMNGYIGAGESSANGSIIAMHGDAVFDFTAIFGGYNENRFYSAKPYVGLGLTYISASGSGSGEFMPIVGLLNEFRISQPLSLHLDLGVITPNAGMYGECVGNPRFFTTSATIGATYFFGKEKKQGFKTVAMSNTYRAIEAKNEIMNENLSDLKRENSALARKNDALQKELEALRAQQAKPAQVIVETHKVTPAPIFFKSERCVPSDADVEMLKYTAEVIKANPSVTYLVEGYADSATGTADYNQTVSDRRAQSVVDALVERYGINKDQLKAVGMGGVDNLADKSHYNRCVIIKAE